jgi:hypothetical protein
VNQQANRPPDDDTQYDVETYISRELSAAELEACSSIIVDGGAVDANAMRRNLPNCIGFAIARTGGQIVGVGAVTRNQIMKLVRAPVFPVEFLFLSRQFPLKSLPRYGQQAHAQAIAPLSVSLGGKFRQDILEINKSSDARCNRHSEKSSENISSGSNILVHSVEELVQQGGSIQWHEADDDAACSSFSRLLIQERRSVSIGSVDLPFQYSCRNVLTTIDHFGRAG